MSLKSIFAAGVLALSAMATSASAQAGKGQFFLCEITSKSARSNWVADSIGFVLQPDGKVVVVDTHVMYFMGGPVTVAPRKSSQKLVRVSWLLTNIKDVRKQPLPPVKYRADLNPAGQSVKVWATLTAYAGAKVSGQGKCKPQKVPKNFKLPG